MGFSYRIGNLIAIIKQGQLHHKTVVVYRLCNSILHILNILSKNGYIYGYYIDKEKKKVFIQLKYNKNKQPIIHECKLLSRPSRRCYIKYDGLSKLTRKTHTYGLLILHTSKGMLTNYDALLHKVGGELIVYIY